MDKRRIRAQQGRRGRKTRRQDAQKEAREMLKFRRAITAPSCSPGGEPQPTEDTRCLKRAYALFRTPGRTQLGTPHRYPGALIRQACCAERHFRSDRSGLRRELPQQCRSTEGRNPPVKLYQNADSIKGRNPTVKLYQNMRTSCSRRLLGFPLGLSHFWG